MYKNNYKNKAAVWIKIFLLTGILCLPGCTKNILVKENVLSTSGKEKILIFPFKNMAAVYGENVNSRCPICGKVFMTGEVAEDADNMLAEQLFILLKDRKDIQLIPASQSQGVISDLLSEDQKSLSERDLLVETGRVLKADWVLSGYIFRFRERVGSKYSVDLPASVTFFNWALFYKEKPDGLLQTRWLCLVLKIFLKPFLFKINLDQNNKHITKTQKYIYLKYHKTSSIKKP